MINLTKISIAIRKFFIWLVIIFIAFVIGKALINIILNSMKRPQLPPIPNMNFGKLPSPKFSTIATSSSGIKFTLENIDGIPIESQPQEATNAGKVYLMPKKSQSILSSARAKETAKRLGFTDEPEYLSSTLYHFDYPKDKLWTLEIDTINLNFKLKYDFRNKPSAIDVTPGLTEEEALKEVKGFIQKYNLFDSSILNGRVTSEPLVYNPDSNTLTKPEKPTSANVYRINFFRSDIDDLKVITPEYSESYNYALYTNTTIHTKVLELSYTFWPMAFDNFATYPLKGAASAWQDLIDGYGTVVSMGNNTPGNVVIRYIRRVYYDSQEPQQYLQPVYVFEGDNDFAAFVPAVSSLQLK